MRALRRAPLLAALPLLLACGHDDPIVPVQFSTTGTWSTTATAGDLSQLTLQLTEDQYGRVSGSWSATRATTGATTGPVTGAHSGTQVQLTLSVVSGSFTGAFASASRLTGTLAIGAGPGTSASFDRQ